MDFKESGCEDGRWMVQDECLLADIDISGVELSGSATRNYVHSFSWPSIVHRMHATTRYPVVYGIHRLCSQLCVQT